FFNLVQIHSELILNAAFMLCFDVLVQHTSCSLTLNESWDSDVK
uniref:UPF0047 protein YjbQ n=1 Tax=Mesocestoides corti TaxID=53468 RepID=A0A5K3F881_MESCO